MRNAASRLPLLLIAAGAAMATGIALGQQPAEIIVEAPHHERAAGAPGGAVTDVVTVTHRVSYKDLDIGTASGAKALEQRIAAASLAACQEIEKLYPVRNYSPSATECAATAKAEAMTRANAAIAAAEKGTRK